MGAIDGDLVVGFVALFDGQIIIFQINVEIGQDQLLANPLPDDSGHFVPIYLNNGCFHLDLVHLGVFPHDLFDDSPL